MAGARVVAKSAFVVVLLVVLVALRFAPVELYCLPQHIKMPPVEIKDVFVARLVSRLRHLRFDRDIKGEFLGVAPVSKGANLRVFRRFPGLCRLLVKLEGLDVALPGITIAALFGVRIDPAPVRQGLLGGAVLLIRQIQRLHLVGIFFLSF